MNNTFSKYTWNDFTPYGVGLDTVFDRLELLTHTQRSNNYPPYNIVKNDSSNYEIEIALAGFKAEEIEVSTEQNVLRVASKVERRDSERVYLHKGLSKRSFTNTWQLADDVRISSVDFVDGLLTISLEKVIPEHQKRTTYTISSGKQQLLTEG